jgi:hypothetical protein
LAACVDDDSGVGYNITAHLIQDRAGMWRLHSSTEGPSRPCPEAPDPSHAGRAPRYATELAQRRTAANYTSLVEEHIFGGQATAEEPFSHVRGPEAHRQAHTWLLCRHQLALCRP